MTSSIRLARSFRELMTSIRTMSDIRPLSGFTGQEAAHNTEGELRDVPCLRHYLTARVGWMGWELDFGRTGAVNVTLPADVRRQWLAAAPEDRDTLLQTAVLFHLRENAKRFAFALWTADLSEEWAVVHDRLRDMMRIERKRAG